MYFLYEPLVFGRCIFVCVNYRSWEGVCVNCRWWENILCENLSSFTFSRSFAHSKFSSLHYFFRNMCHLHLFLGCLCHLHFFWSVMCHLHIFQIPLVDFHVEKMPLNEETLTNWATLCSLACAAVRTDRDKDTTPRAPLATSTGSIDSLGKWVSQRSCGY